MKFFTADPHIQHKKILQITQRPYQTIDDHDLGLIEWVNTTVGRRDELTILGDAGWGKISWYRAQIKCRTVHFIWGNHDKPSYAKNFSSAVMCKMVKVGPPTDKHACWLSHYPHAYWPASHKRSWHLYGHLHDQREATLDKMMPGRQSMDVGIDTALRLLGAPRPFSEMEIYDIMMQRPGHDDEQFYKDLDKAREQNQPRRPL